ncbi:hypothetical protein ACWGKW_24005 [Streptomyces sp. NPDC054766]
MHGPGPRTATPCVQPWSAHSHGPRPAAARAWRLPASALPSEPLWPPYWWRPWRAAETPAGLHGAGATPTALGPTMLWPRLPPASTPAVDYGEADTETVKGVTAPGDDAHKVDPVAVVGRRRCWARVWRSPTPRTAERWRR